MAQSSVLLGATPFAVGWRTFASIVLLVVLGIAAVYLLLPRPRRYSLVAGGILGLVSLVPAAALVGPLTFTVEALLFYVFSAIAVVSGCLLITQRNPARAALSFALVVLSTCGLFLLLAAPFLMAATIIIYAGAIIVTFLFVLMLAQQEGPSDADNRSREPLLSALAGFVLLGTILYVLADTYTPPVLDQLDSRLKAVDEKVARMSAPAQPTSDQEAEARLTDLDKFLGEFLNWIADRSAPSESEEQGQVLPADGKPLERAVEDAQKEVTAQKNNLQNQKPVEWHEVYAELAKIQSAGNRTRNSFGLLQPAEGRPLSDFSGPAANLPLEDQGDGRTLRRDEQGRPQLPAENVAYLGRSLFTDYLLAVELGGTLLLVATIGAIAIATRRAERIP